MSLRFRDLLGVADGTPVEVHQPPIRRRMRNDHAATAPVACCMRPGTRRRIAHAERLGQLQGNAALLQVRFAAAAWQSSLEARQGAGPVQAVLEQAARGLERSAERCLAAAAGKLGNVGGGWRRCGPRCR